MKNENFIFLKEYSDGTKEYRLPTLEEAKKMGKEVTSEIREIECIRKKRRKSKDFSWYSYFLFWRWSIFSRKK